MPPAVVETFLHRSEVSLSVRFLLLLPFVHMPSSPYLLFLGISHYYRACAQRFNHSIRRVDLGVSCYDAARPVAGSSDPLVLSPFLFSSLSPVVLALYQPVLPI
jgi:hypothetical protein